MERVVEIGDLLVAAVDRQGVLDQVVGADGEKIRFRRERVCGQRTSSGSLEIAHCQP